MFPFHGIMVLVYAGLKSAQYILQKKSKTFPDNGPGFTLLELMISMTIIAMIMLIVYGALRIGIKAWEKGEEKMLSSQEYRIVLNLIQTQLASLYSGNIVNNGKKPFYLKGDDTSLEFLSGISMVPGNKYGIVHVMYKVSDEQKEKKLSFYEKNISFLSNNIDSKDINADDYYDLLSGMYKFGFEYLKDVVSSDIIENKLQWQQTWDSEKDKGFPRAVRIGFQADEQSAPVYIVVSIKEKPIN